MDIAHIKEELITSIKELPVWNTNSMETQWTIRCPFCGDSYKHLDHGHLSIYINRDDDTTPMMYRCLRCNESGLVDQDLLQQLDLNISSDGLRNIRSYNNRLKKTNRYVNKFADNDFTVPIFSSSDLHSEKLAYINRRLGTTISYEQAQQFNLILDIFEFMTVNKIKAIPGMSFKQLKFLNYNYVGFLSANRNQIICRSIRTDPNIKRYYKIVIDPTNLSTNKYYNITSYVDLMYCQDINVCIAEGTFDILSVYLNANQFKDPTLFYAGCGFNFSAVMRYLIYNGITTGINLHVYADNDKLDRDLIKEFSAPNIKPWLDHMYIHRNGYGSEKDYGVPSDRIKDQFIKIV